MRQNKAETTAGGTRDEPVSDRLASDGHDVGFALIVGCARSGTTLLRLLLDAHPDVGCPSEAGIPALVTHMARVWAIIDADSGALQGPLLDPGQAEVDGRETVGDQDKAGEARPSIPAIPEEVRSWINSAVQAATANYCTPRRKRVYVDKSLDSVYHLGLVRQVYPDLKSLIVVRHIMDTIASGIEASPWGFQAYGYGPYVQASPGNTVAALGRYWLDHVDAALAWEEQHRDECLRVRYEDLVSRPEETIRLVEQFLGVPEDLEVLQTAFEREPAHGPGDYKVIHTRGIHQASLGRGKRIPVEMLPEQLLEAVNKKLEVLGYSQLDTSWNASERAVETSSETVWTRQLAELMAHTLPEASTTELGSLAVVCEDNLELRWVVDIPSGTVVQGDGEVESVITGTAEDLVLLLTGAENLGVLFRSGRIRHVVADADEAQQRDLLRELDALVASLRAGSYANHSGAEARGNPT